MHREYDFTLITRGELNDTDRAKVIEGYETLMTKDGGEILKRDDWGVKKLAFPIKKAFRGHYVNYDFIGTPPNMAEMERLMRIDDNVLRYMTVRLDTRNRTGKIDADLRRQEIAKADAMAKESEEKKKIGRN